MIPKGHLKLRDVQVPFPVKQERACNGTMCEHQAIRSRIMRVRANEIAPDFNLADIHGQFVSLSQFRGKRNVLLVFNRSFV